ncbi:hypothetical protein [Tenacibaculum maritimum]|uniref:hypothetical protein n=1 Tax=Tenacibaculum maritimum TaxID=107401 RepID=UPI0038775641
MKKTLKYISLAIMAGITFSSCSDEQSGLNASNYKWEGATVTLTTDTPTYTINEKNISDDDFVIEVNASIAKPQAIDAVIDLVKLSGTVNSSDYTLGQIKIPAGLTSAKSSIKIHKTGDIEKDESLVVGAVSKGNFTVSNFKLPINVTDDYINDQLVFSATWAGSYTYTPPAFPISVTIDFCDIDIDMYLFDENNNLVGPISETTSCTETGALLGLPDGKYKVALNIYENPLADLGTNQPLPVTVTYNQDFFIDSTTFVYSGLNTNDASGTVFVAEVEVKDGYKYTVTSL